MQAEREDDDVVAERVRAELGRVVSQPGAVVVAVEHGVVTLSGQATEREREDLIAVTRWVRGVRDLEDRLETRESAPASGSQG
jgi:osmotically-inducible protein OsmY